MTDEQKRTLLRIISRKGNCNGIMCSIDNCPVVIDCVRLSNSNTEPYDRPAVLNQCLVCYAREFGIENLKIDLVEALV